MSRFKAGDKVEWNTPQGKTRGVVKKKVTERGKVKGHRYRPSAQEPEYLVESAKSGKRAAHREKSLKKIRAA